MYFIKPVYATEKPANPKNPWQILPYAKYALHQNLSPRPLLSVRPFHVR